MHFCAEVYGQTVAINILFPHATCACWKKISVAGANTNASAHEVCSKTLQLHNPYSWHTYADTCDMCVCMCISQGRRTPFFKILKPCFRMAYICKCHMWCVMRKCCLGYVTDLVYHNQRYHAKDISLHVPGAVSHMWRFHTCARILQASTSQASYCSQNKWQANWIGDCQSKPAQSTVRVQFCFQN